MKTIRITKATKVALRGNGFVDGFRIVCDCGFVDKVADSPADGNRAKIVAEDHNFRSHGRKFQVVRMVD